MGLTEFIKRANNKNNRLFYQVTSLLDVTKPRFIKRLERRALLSEYDRLSPELKAHVDKRVAHYIKLPQGTPLEPVEGKEAIYSLSDLGLHATFNGVRSRSNYCYDAMRYLRCYDKQLKASFVFGDVWWIPSQPSFVKSRPIEGDNSNSVLLKLNHIRHFNFVRDSRAFESKTDQLIGISSAKQEHRQRFVQIYFGHPLCRLGFARHFSCDDERAKWNVDFVSIDEQLQYKFILCLEGHDVATNLKWVMSSNSVAVMPKPKFETWFMESTLTGGVHYVEIADDYSNLEERLQYYINHPEECQKIVEAAHKHIDQFRNKRLEKIISIKVAEEYFVRTGQRV